VWVDEGCESSRRVSAGGEPGWFTREQLAKEASQTFPLGDAAPSWLTADTADVAAVSSSHPAEPSEHASTGGREA
jgi:hypothetical protein